MIARTTDIVASEQEARSPHVIELRVVVEVQVPQWMHPGGALGNSMQAGAVSTVLSPCVVISQRPPNADPLRGESQEGKKVPDQDVNGSAFFVTHLASDSDLCLSGTSPVSPITTTVAGPTFEDVFWKHVFPIKQLETKPSVQAEYRTAVKHFVEWFKNNHRSGGPMVADLCQQPQLLSEFYTFSLGKGSEKTASNKLKCLKSIWRDMFDLELITRSVPKPRTKQIRKKEGVEKTDHIPMPVTDSELTRCLNAVLELHDDLTYPRLGKLEPFQFWFNVFAICAVHGIRPAEFWPLDKHSGVGLEWSEVCFAESPPISDGENLQAEWEFGWLNLRMNKTGRRLRTPMSPHLRFLIQQCVGLDSERVFPLPYNSQRWYTMLSMILTRAGFSKVKFPDEEKVKWPVTLCGSSPQKSLRKTASVLWRRHGTPRLASFMLGHSSRTGSSSDVDEGSEITEEHYSGSETFRDVIAAFPRVLGSLPDLIRC